PLSLRHEKVIKTDSFYFITKYHIDECHKNETR
ncbi:MAG: hypothetical protein ACI81W_004237, partial [Saprospiraceae bacterium]